MAVSDKSKKPGKLKFGKAKKLKPEEIKPKKASKPKVSKPEKPRKPRKPHKVGKPSKNVASRPTSSDNDIINHRLDAIPRKFLPSIGSLFCFYFSLYIVFVACIANIDRISGNDFGLSKNIITGIISVFFLAIFMLSIAYIRRNNRARFLSEFKATTYAGAINADAIFTFIIQRKDAKIEEEEPSISPRGIISEGEKLTNGNSQTNEEGRASSPDFFDEIALSYISPEYREIFVEPKSVNSFDGVNGNFDLSQILNSLNFDEYKLRIFEGAVKNGKQCNIPVIAEDARGNFFEAQYVVFPLECPPNFFLVKILPKNIEGASKLESDKQAMIRQEIAQDDILQIEHLEDGQSKNIKNTREHPPAISSANASNDATIATSATSANTNIPGGNVPASNATDEGAKMKSIEELWINFKTNSPCVMLLLAKNGEIIAYNNIAIDNFFPKFVKQTVAGQDISSFLSSGVNILDFIQNEAESKNLQNSLTNWTLENAKIFTNLSLGDISNLNDMGKAEDNNRVNSAIVPAYIFLTPFNVGDVSYMATIFEEQIAT